MCPNSLKKVPSPWLGKCSPFCECVKLIFVRGGPMCVFKACWDDWRLERDGRMDKGGEVGLIGLNGPVSGSEEQGE